MTRRHLFGMLAAVIAAPLMKVAAPAPRPYAFTMSESGPEFIVPGSSFEWKNVEGYASGGLVGEPIVIPMGGVTVERIWIKGQRLDLTSAEDVVRRFDDLATKIRTKESERPFFA